MTNGHFVIQAKTLGSYSKLRWEGRVVLPIIIVTHPPAHAHTRVHTHTHAHTHTLDKYRLREAGERDAQHYVSRSPKDKNTSNPCSSLTLLNLT